MNITPAHLAIAATILIQSSAAIKTQIVMLAIAVIVIVGAIQNFTS